MNITQTARMMDRIKFLVNLDDDACVLIFTRADAEAMLPEDRKIDSMTDDEWNAIVRDFDKHFLDDSEWEYFSQIVNRNLEARSNHDNHRTAPAGPGNHPGA